MINLSFLRTLLRVIFMNESKNKYKAQPDPYNFKETGKFIAEYLKKPKEKEAEIKNEEKRKK